MRNAEKQIDELQNEHAEVTKQLRNPELTPEKRAELQDRRKEINSRMTKAQDDRQEKENILASGLGEKRELSNLSKEEIEKKSCDLSTKISKCNLVAHNLLNGNNWDHINTKLDNWQNRKFTAKDAKSIDPIETARKVRKEKVDKFMENYKPNLDRDPVHENETSKDNKPALTFADKHPRLARIGNFFKGIKDRFFRKEKEDIQNTETKEPVKKEETVEDKNTGDKSFRDYIRQVAEKGMDGIAAEEKAARQQAAKEKLAQTRAANRAAEAKKFGQDYADRSDYRKDDDGR